MKFSALTIDTCTVQSNGYNFDEGLLAKIIQFRGSTIRFVISEIVAREIKKHLDEELDEARKKIESALKEARRKNLFSDENITLIEGIIKNEPSTSDLTEKRLAQFLRNTGGSEIPANKAEISNLIEYYFSHKAPFENNKEKRKEFPDAIALLSLQKWAEENDKYVLAVSNDNGWNNYESNNQRITVVKDLDVAIDKILQQQISDQYKSCKIIANKFFTQSDDSECLVSIKTALSDYVSEQDVEIEYCSSYYGVREEWSPDVELEDFFIDIDKITIVEIKENYFTVEVNLRASIIVTGNFSFYIWDSIDKEEIPWGSLSVVKDVDAECSALIHIAIPNDPSDTDVSIFEDIPIEISGEIGSVDFGDIKPDDEHDE